MTHGSRSRALFQCILLISKAFLKFTYGARCARYNNRHSQPIPLTDTVHDLHTCNDRKIKEGIIIIFALSLFFFGVFGRCLNCLKIDFVYGARRVCVCVWVQPGLASRHVTNDPAQLNRSFSCSPIANARNAAERQKVTNGWMNGNRLTRKEQ